MKFIKTFLLCTAVIATSLKAQSFPNPFKPGGATVEIADRKIKLTRSTSCRKSRHRDWRGEHSCVCCLLKRGIRKKGFKSQGKKAFDYCIQKKKYCNETHIATMARRYGMIYRPHEFNYKMLHKHIYKAHSVRHKPSFYENLYNRFFKRRASEQHQYKPQATHPDNHTFAEEQAARASAENQGHTLSPEDQQAYASNRPGTVEIIVRKADSVTFGRLLNPVKINGRQYLYIVAHDDMMRGVSADRRYIVFRNIEQSKIGRHATILLRAITQNGLVEGTNIRATEANTIMPTSNAA